MPSKRFLRGGLFVGLVLVGSGVLVAPGFFESNSTRVGVVLERFGVIVVAALLLWVVRGHVLARLAWLLRRWPLVRWMVAEKTGGRPRSREAVPFPRKLREGVGRHTSAVLIFLFVIAVGWWFYAPADWLTEHWLFSLAVAVIGSVFVGLVRAEEFSSRTWTHPAGLWGARLLGLILVLGLVTAVAAATDTEHASRIIRSLALFAGLVGVLRFLTLYVMEDRDLYLFTCGWPRNYAGERASNGPRAWVNRFYELDPKRGRKPITVEPGRSLLGADWGRICDECYDFAAMLLADAIGRRTLPPILVQQFMMEIVAELPCQWSFSVVQVETWLRLRDRDEACRRDLCRIMTKRRGT